MTDETVSCPKCATEVPSGAFLCANCGHTIGGNDSGAPQRPARSSATERTLALRAAVPEKPVKGKPKREKSPEEEAAERARLEAEKAKLEVEKAKKEAERIAAEQARVAKEAEKAAAKEAARVAAEQAKAAKKAEKDARNASAREAKANEVAARDAARSAERGAASREATDRTDTGSRPTPTPTAPSAAPSHVAPEPAAPADTTPTPTEEPARRRATATDRVNALRAATPQDGSAPKRPAKPAPAPRPTTPRPERRRAAPAGDGSRPAGASLASRLAGAAAVLAIFAVAGAGVAVLRGSDSDADEVTSGFGVEPDNVSMPDLPLESSRYADVIEGTGEPAEVGDTLTVNYVYYRSSTGEQIDSSFRRNEPWTFVLGAGEVIAGLDKGLVGAKAGGRRQLDILPELAYGDAGIEGVLGAGETLTFVVDIVSVVSGPPPTDATTTTSTTLPPDPNETALAGLAVQIEQDRAQAATLTGTWVLQLSAEYVGLSTDSAVLDAQTIFATLQERLADYPVLLLDAADWQWDTEYSAPTTIYITVVGLPFNTRTEARAWAENNGISRDEYQLIAFPEPVA